MTEFTIKRGLEAYHTHEELLTKVEERFGVPPSVLVALWGVESSFGRNCGDFDSVQALLTLAYQCNQVGPTPLPLLCFSAANKYNVIK